MKTCPKCQLLLPLEGFPTRYYSNGRRGHQYICKKCKAILGRPYSKLYEKEKRKRPVGYWKYEYNRRIRATPKKVKARWKVHQAIRSKKLIKEPCKICGNAESQGHHEDYSKPLDVIWLCKTCHSAHHIKK